MSTLEPPRPDDRYQRQRLFAPLGSEGDARLRKSHVLVVGCGALGSHAAELLARAGVGNLALVDRDVVEWSNLHRQTGFTEADARAETPKAVATAEHLRRVNSGIHVQAEVADFNARNARRLAKGADLILDGTDNLPTRFLINDLSLSTDTPWVYGGAIGDQAHAQLYLPGQGPCLRCLLPELPPAGSVATCDTAGVIGPAPAAAASYEVSLALRTLAEGREGTRELAGMWIRLGLWDVSASISHVKPDPQCPACAGGHRDFLDGGSGEASTVLCGRGAIQILPAVASQDRVFDLDALAGRLSEVGQVDRQRFLIRFRPTAGASEHGTPRITVFRDGRAIVEGARDETVARSLYDRYIGR